MSGEHGNGMDRFASPPSHGPENTLRGRENALRGEASLMVGGTARLLRPSFTALVAAEDELGPLFALVERAGAGQLRLSEVAALFWHCMAQRDALTRETVGEAVVSQGLAACAVPLRTLLAQILQGRSD